MSNHIPFVSSSPPPIDDAQSFGWDDDEDDDFGNFTSAPPVLTENKMVSSDEGFAADWSQATFNIDDRKIIGSSEEISPNLCDVKASDGCPDCGPKDFRDQTSTNKQPFSNNCDDNGLAAFQSDFGSADRRHIGALSLAETMHQEKSIEISSGHNAATLGTEVVKNNRDSLNTDSGVFSADFSPVPKSESFCSVGEGEDQTLHSEDEMFCDSPQDFQKISSNHALPCTTVTDVESQPNTAAGNTEAGQESEESDLSSVQDDISENNCELGIIDEIRTTEPTLKQMLTGDSLKAEEVTSVSDTPDVDKQSLSSSDRQSRCDISSSLEPLSDSLQNQISIQESDLRRMDALEDARQEEDVTWQHEDADTTEHVASQPAFPLIASRYSEDLALKTYTDSVEFGNHAAGVDEEFGDFSSHVVSLPGSDKEENGRDSSAALSACDASSELSSVLSSKDAASEVVHLSFSSKAPSERDEFADLSSEGATNDEGDFTSKETSSGDNDVNVENCDALVARSEMPNDDLENGESVEFLSETAEQENGGDGNFHSLPTRLEEEEVEGCINKIDNIPSTISALECIDVKSIDFPPNGLDHNDSIDDFAEFSSRNAHINEGNFGDFSSMGAKGGSQEEEDIEDFKPRASTISPVDVVADVDDFGDFSYKEAVTKLDGGDDDDADDEVCKNDEVFGDFKVQQASTEGSTSASLTDNSAAVSEHAIEDNEQFGDFSGQSAVVADTDNTGWANFSSPSTSSDAHTNNSNDDDDEFSSFADAKPAISSQECSSTTTFAVKAQDTSQADRIVLALQKCFPEIDQPCHDQTCTVDTEQSSSAAADDDDFTKLDSVLEFGLSDRSAKQQTWEVVQHPAKKDPRVRLWSHLHDVDGSPAIIYHWGKSCANTHLFRTLHIDTENMLIGHKKPSVPIFATGLSLLEPIRGGSRNRGLGLRPQPGIALANAASLVLADHSQSDMEISATQEIPAVDFDWSSSGLTNPLTSKSLDLDFLVVQDNDNSEKLSVFESEILDAPRSGIKPSSQPLEDIMKSVKPTGVRYRQDDSAPSQLSAEALKVLASLPNLRFMQSKVLMFPIKN